MQDTNGGLANATVQTVCFCDLLILGREDFDQVLREHMVADNVKNVTETPTRPLLARQPTCSRLMSRNSRKGSKMAGPSGRRGSCKRLETVDSFYQTEAHSAAPAPASSAHLFV